MRAVVPLLVLALLAGCSSPEPQKPSVVRLFPPAWVSDADAGWDPVSQPGTLFATGRAALQADRAATSKRAEDDARKKLEPRVRQVLGRLQLVYTDLHKAELQPAQLEALRADDAAARQLLANLLAGARLKGQWEDEFDFFAWLGLDMPAVLQPAFEADLAVRLHALARELTDADREAFKLVIVSFAAERGAP